MKNVTVSLDEETALWTRIEAASHDMSVSRFVGEVLRERMESSENFDQARRSYLTRAARPLRSSDCRMPTRDEIHQR
ncbi:MAG: hypothetical protein OXE79_06780 [Acidimicrobiaceae bacterium]|nr:hypothetical protein [Acidimicrobiaceae bacterium]MCY4176171.1 hypothetical protein [Acidimicrobiaceae bacterium]MCY4281150.1 hypothetical protein [Acidimicrobiaceae bacterium]MCY4294375.1 hypothetical protein [Acidimicrobiaceae bacterium]